MSPRSRREEVIDCCRAVAASSSRAAKRGAFFTTSLSTADSVPCGPPRGSPRHRGPLGWVRVRELPRRDPRGPDQTGTEDVPRPAGALPLCPLRAGLHHPARAAGRDRAVLETMIQSTGFYRAKTDALIKLGQALVERFDGEVPGKLESLVTLPGVGRKTANVVLGNAFGVPGITVDTHFARLSRRFGWTAEEDPVKIEHAVGALIARKPACGACPIARWCPSYGEGETDPVKAAKLLKYELAPDAS